MRALVRTVDGVFEVDLDEEVVLGSSLAEVEPEPVAVSNDAGRTWREAGGGLPPGLAIAIADDDPDYVLFAARNRLYLSTNGGVFWRALSPELPEIEAVSLTA